MRSYLFGCPLFFQLVIFISLHSQVRLNEIMFNPAGPEKSDEFIEIVHVHTAETIDLAGWKISDGSGEDSIIDAGFTTLLQPGQYAVVLDPDYFSESVSYDSLIPPEALVLTIDGSTFGSSGFSNSKSERISLIDSEGAEISFYTYFPDEITAGRSVERVSFSEDEWRMSEQPNGTPGYVNSVSPLSVDPELCDVIVRGDSSGTDKLNILTTVVNSGRTQIESLEVHACWIEDSLDVFNEPDWSVSTSITTAILSGDTVVVEMEILPVRFGECLLAVVLECSGDQDRENNVIWKSLCISYPFGSILISEVMYTPLSGEEDWVELYHPGGEAISLKDWRIKDANSDDGAVLSGPETFYPGTYCVVGKDSMPPDQMEHSSIYFRLSSFPNLNQDGDCVWLIDGSGTVVDSMAYESDSSVPAGISIERISFDLPASNASNWSVCTDLKGATPGMQNSLFLEAGLSGLLLEIHPNPFSPDSDGFEDTMMIEYHVEMQHARIRLQIYDVRGRCVRTLKGSSMTGSAGRILWDGRDDTGRLVRIAPYILYFEAIDDMQGKVVQKKEELVVAGKR